MLERAYIELYRKPCPFNYKISFSGKFKGYNANAKRIGNNIEINLSKKWKSIDEDITIGLIQELLIKIHKKTKKRTPNMDLYHIFLKKVHLSIPKTKTDPILRESFDKLNGQFFSHTLEIPNLAWGSFSTSKLGSYDYGTDTVTISKILHPDFADKELLDYIMYHELLHKAEKFQSSGLRTFHHTKHFKQREQLFPNHKLLEKELSHHIRKMKYHSSRPKKAQKTPKSLFQRILNEFLS